MGESGMLWGKTARTPHLKHEAYLARVQKSLCYQQPSIICFVGLGSQLGLLQHNFIHCVKFGVVGTLRAVSRIEGEAFDPKDACVVSMCRLSS